MSDSSDVKSPQARLWQVTMPAGMLAVAMMLAGCNDGETEVGGEPAANHGQAPADKAVVLTGDEANAAVEAGETTAYPLDVCIVSGEKLGSMGPPPLLVYNSQEIKFCCSGCDTMFLENPAAHLVKLASPDAPNEAADEQEDEHDHDHDHG
ncbi:MAG: hypothetical protein WD118_00325 [Phycisphaeraceae bacterium]